jgi:WXG100 family type VII secretion target
MADLSVSTQELRNASTSLDQSTTSLQDEISRMTARISEMRSMWTGETSNRFEDRWIEWQQSADRLNQALSEISTFLKTAAQTYEDAEGSTSSALG